MSDIATEAADASTNAEETAEQTTSEVDTQNDTAPSKKSGDLERMHNKIQEHKAEKDDIRAKLAETEAKLAAIEREAQEKEMSKDDILEKRAVELEAKQVLLKQLEDSNKSLESRIADMESSRQSEVDALIGALPEDKRPPMELINKLENVEDRLAMAKQFADAHGIVKPSVGMPLAQDKTPEAKSKLDIARENLKTGSF